MVNDRVRFAILVVIGTSVLGCSETNSQLAPTPSVTSITGRYGANVSVDMRSCVVSGTPAGSFDPGGLGYVGSGQLDQRGGQVMATWSSQVTQLILKGTLTKDNVIAFTLDTFLFNPYQGGTSIAGYGTATVQQDGRIIGTFEGEAVNRFSARIQTCRSTAHTIELQRRT